MRRQSVSAQRQRQRSRTRDAARSGVPYKGTVEAVLAAEEFMNRYRFDPGKRLQIERLIREPGDKLW